jgi:hypothetical protein
MYTCLSRFITTYTFLAGFLHFYKMTQAHTTNSTTRPTASMKTKTQQAQQPKTTNNRGTQNIYRYRQATQGAEIWRVRYEEARFQTIHS